MRNWIDNTGLHSAGELLINSKIKTDLDVKGLVQLATLLIFSDKIVFNGYEIGDIAEKSNEIVGKLISLGVNKSDITSINDVGSYLEVVRETAAECASELSFVNFNNVDSSVLRPSTMPQYIVEAETSYIAIALTPKSLAELEDLKLSYLKDGSAKIIHYMVADNEDLRTALKQLNSKVQFTSEILLQVYFYLRYCINQNLAKRNSAIYTPAVGRQQIIRNEHDFVLTKIDETIKNVVAKESLQTTNLPSVAQYLIQKSNGDPFTLIEESLKAREKAVPLRKQLSKLLAKNDIHSTDGKFSVSQELKELSSTLETELGLSKQTKWSDAFDLMLMPHLIPVPVLKISEVAKWIDSWRKRKKATILTEISKEIIYNQIKLESNYRKLLTNTSQLLRNSMINHKFQHGKLFRKQFT